MSALEITNAHVSIEDKEILKGVSLTVKSGEIHAIMGPNGSGKSTMASTLAGHPSFSVGEETHISLNGESILEMSPDERARKGLFLAFQYPTEIPGVSVQNFLRAMWEARFGPIGNHEAKEGRVFATPYGNLKFSSVLEFRRYLEEQAQRLSVNPELLKRNLNEGFSGGERKRVEILQMAVFQPEFAILDETDSGLDIDAVKTVARGAREIVEQYNSGVVVITHYQRILQFLKPHFVHVLAHGKIVESGGPELAARLEKEGYAQYTVQA